MIPLAIPPQLQAIAQALQQAGGRPVLVGGAVRDHLLNLGLPKDLDLEVYGLSFEVLCVILQRFGKVSEVGKSFGVLKLATPEAEYDFSFPRTENKIGKGHKGFHVFPDAQLSFDQAAARRDFTINAMGYDLTHAQLLDPYGGQEDLRRRLLRHIGPAFAEDPLRVMRGIQFAARFEFQMAPETIQLCRQLELSELPRERFYEEFKKLWLRAPRPSRGLELLREVEGLRYFPELEALVGVPQDPEWHPEGDVWVHTCMVVDEAASLRNGDIRHDLKLMWGALCHDFGKPLTTEWKEGRWRSHAHDTLGIEPAERFLRRLTEDHDLIETVKVYVRDHLRPALLYNRRQEVSDGAIRRLALGVSIPDLVEIARADHLGRTTSEALARQFPAGDWLLERAARLNVQREKPQPWLLGRHLIALGVPPGPVMGELLRRAFELQLDGHLHSLEEAQTWAQSQCQPSAESDSVLQ